MRRLIVMFFAVATLAVTAAAQEGPVEEHDIEPCIPESVFDDRCDEGGGDSRCFEDCRACTTINDHFGCYRVYWAGACSCWMEWGGEDGNGDPLLVCTERGTCSVLV